MAKRQLELCGSVCSQHVQSCLLPRTFSPHLSLTQSDLGIKNFNVLVYNKYWFVELMMGQAVITSWVAQKLSMSMLLDTELISVDTVGYAIAFAHVCSTC